MTEDNLHALLASYDAGEPSAELRARIVAMAPRERSVGRLRRWAMGLGLGLGLAASCAAGAAAGFTLAPESVRSLIVGPVEPAAGDSGSLADPAADAAIA
jgi:hypothetical protein